MNSIALVPATRIEFDLHSYWGAFDYLDIEVDGKPLVRWVDNQGPPLVLVPPFGWGGSPGKAHSYDVAQLLGEQPSDLESGRVPVLLCEGCCTCAVYSVRILVEGDQVRWTDWAYVGIDGLDDTKPLVELDNLTNPGDFVFDRQT